MLPQQIQTPDSDDRISIQQRLVARQILEDRRRKYPIYSFVPNEGAQVQFFTAYYIERSEKCPDGKYRLVKRRIAFGGNQFGKTTISVVEAYCFMVGERPFMPLNSPYRKMPFNPPVHVLYMSESFPSVIKNDVIPMIYKWFPAEDIVEVKRNTQGIEYYFKLKSGSSITLMSYEQPVESFEGSKWHAVIFNEPMPRNIYIAVSRGLMAYGGYVIMAMTLLSEPWIQDEIIDKADGKSIVSIHGSIYENTHITEEEINEFIKTLDPSEVEVRVMGKALHLQGLIYPEFNEAVHVFDPFTTKPFAENGGKPLPHWTRYMVADPHDRKPFAMIWCAVDEDENIWVYDEYPEGEFHRIKYDGKTIFELCEHIKLKEEGADIQLRLIDNTRGNKNEVGTGLTIKQEFANYGIYFSDAPTRPEEANRKALRKYLFYDRSKEVSYTNKPKIFISKYCKNVIYSLKHFMYDNWNNKADEKREIKDKPREKNKCHTNDLEYICRYEPTFNPVKIRRRTEMSDRIVPSRNMLLQQGESVKEIHITRYR